MWISSIPPVRPYPEDIVSCCDKVFGANGSLARSYYAVLRSAESALLLLLAVLGAYVRVPLCITPSRDLRLNLPLPSEKHELGETHLPCGRNMLSVFIVSTTCQSNRRPPETPQNILSALRWDLSLT